MKSIVFQLGKEKEQNQFNIESWEVLTSLTSHTQEIAKCILFVFSCYFMYVNDCPISFLMTLQMEFYVWLEITQFKKDVNTLERLHWKLL